MNSPHDRRSSQRLSLQCCEATLRVGEGIWVPVEVVDLSPNGVGVRLLERRRRAQEICRAALEVPKVELAFELALATTVSFGLDVGLEVFGGPPMPHFTKVGGSVKSVRSDGGMVLGIELGPETSPEDRRVVEIFHEQTIAGDLHPIWW